MPKTESPLIPLADIAMALNELRRHHLAAGHAERAAGVQSALTKIRGLARGAPAAPPAPAA